ncbi:MAG: hypothetical protein HY907_00805 [Deltaproteobacteria bacterium]|nr:hypothetical protein [Deltaproteobacteria bacterium]
MSRSAGIAAALCVFAAGCPSAATRDGDADTDADRATDGGDAEAPETPEATDSLLDDLGVDGGEGDAGEDAEGWDFGADLWDPMRDCDAAPADPLAWVAPPCGDGCRQVAFAAQPRGQFAASERWLAYRAAHRTWMVNLDSGDEAVLFCHPEFVGSYGIGVDGDAAVLAIGTDFPTDLGHVAYGALWATDLVSLRQWAVADWVNPYPAQWAAPFQLAQYSNRVALTVLQIRGDDPSSWVQRIDVLTADIRTGLTTPVTDLGWPCCLGWPDIGGNWVVYSTTDAVRAYDIERGVTIGADIVGDQIWPRTDGVNVIWIDHRNYPGGYGRGGSWDIYSYNFVSEAERRITTPATPVAEDAEPDMLGDIVVWSDRRNATPEEPHHSDLFLWRYSTGSEQQLTFAAGAARSPKVTSDGVFFDWVPNPEPDPYLADHAICKQDLPPP